MREPKSRQAVVVGGSIGGLTTALLLRDLGWDVDVFERSTRDDARGGGIVLQPDTVRWFTERSTQALENLTTSTNLVQYLGSDNHVAHREYAQWSYSSWATLHSALLRDYGVERYRRGHRAVAVAQDASTATVEFDNGSFATGDLVVFADGVNSVGRQYVSPNTPIRYSGYIGWRGLVPERLLSSDTNAALEDSVTYALMPDSHIVMYPVPSPIKDGRTERLMNFVWYRNVPAGRQLDQFLGGESAGILSLHPNQVPHVEVDRMQIDAARDLPPAAAEVVSRCGAPYVQVVSDIRAAQMVRGRVAILGDAACAARPHAAAGTAKAAADAWSLATAIEKTDGLDQALQVWEPIQLALSARLESRVQAMGERSQFENSWHPEDPELRFGLYGPGI
ncbi:FAD binding domain-containing protein [Streptomyces doebereineriae]|uniref:Monooxygenase n=1 Tax=Streptomyces doebereineriae TaxID=3075528 RepID=A0ABU2VEW1_9ACTN|nr:FAD-dependent monooxygenase [Streptomyces sp. DSM 41640]MDT0484101.1 monooxygenase [Streptomyces sp. DSM 41640]